MNKTYIGDGQVVLLSGGGKIFTDIAARFVGSERSLAEIIASPYDKQIIQNILESNHYSATEFDYFIFGIEGYSRVTEVQLVRKRLASYLIKSGRINKHGKRSFDVVLPHSIEEFSCSYRGFPMEDVILPDGTTLLESSGYPEGSTVRLHICAEDLLNMIECWYNNGVNLNIPEEELRYLKPMATSTRIIFGITTHGLLDWFKIRCCQNCMKETRDLANKILKLCKDAAPDLFENAGASCVSLGYCPENTRQHPNCQNKIPTHKEVLNLIQTHTTLKALGYCAKEE